MKNEWRVILNGDAEQKARNHLLKSIQRGQEDICFALWTLSTGASTRTAIVDEVLIPKQGERHLHGGASVEPIYTVRATHEAARKGKGLALMHSHPYPGWQDMSYIDADTEGNNIAWTADETGMPFIGMTIGDDGYWSARAWESTRKGNKKKEQWCRAVQITGTKNGALHFNPRIAPIPQRTRQLKRTRDAWGDKAQGALARARVGVVGLGSVGCIIAEAMARIGVQEITLIDGDLIETHNLDRLLYGYTGNVGKRKVCVAQKRVRKACTAKSPKIKAIDAWIQEEKAYRAAIDCNILFSCVDRPIPRETLNQIAVAHMIPLFDGGVAIKKDKQNKELEAAKWVAQLVSPGRQCLLCSRQYDSGMLSTELDGSLDNPSYTERLEGRGILQNENVFPFALSAAAMQINLMVRYFAAPNWWPEVARQEYDLAPAYNLKESKDCHEYCRFRESRGKGDKAKPPHGKKV